MEIFLAVITAILAVATVSEADRYKIKFLAACFCTSVIALTILVLS